MKEYKCENCGTEFSYDEREEGRGDKICCPDCGTETAKRETKPKKGSSQGAGRSPSEDVAILDTPQKIAADGGEDAGGDETDSPPETPQFGGGDTGGAGAERQGDETGSSSSGSSDSGGSDDN